jgi:predicted RNA binding protein YcfA (HicA-like mRNA interferase family)
MDLAKKLQRFGYQVTRQTGSHVRLTTQQNGEHHVTIPRHGSLRVGTLSAVLKEVSEHLEIGRDQLVAELGIAVVPPKATGTSPHAIRGAD